MPAPTIESALEYAEAMSGRLLVDAVEPFVVAAGLVLQEVCRETFTRQQVRASRSLLTRDDWNSVVAVQGDRVAGLVTYSMSEFTACRVAARMVDGDVLSLDGMALSALSELTNMITGRASMGLEANGFRSSISPPRLLRGTGKYVCPRPLLWLDVPLKTRLGTLTVAVALRQARE
ncbi:MAG: chemotaxis protein CheX [Chloroflexi bacterium]|nr:chemotaxis protein CheX [Chloroflexota bacterium]